MEPRDNLCVGFSLKGKIIRKCTDTEGYIHTHVSLTASTKLSFLLSHITVDNKRGLCPHPLCILGHVSVPPKNQDDITRILSRD